MGLHKNRNGLFNMCDNGLVQFSDCPDFDCRPIIHVDKHAAGTDDGSSWANAYADIQTAINAHPCNEIQIHGYGENDCYSAGVVLAECCYIKGIDDVWIDGEDIEIFGIDGNNLDSTKINAVNIKNCRNTGIKRCNEVINSTVKNISQYLSSHGAFLQCNSLDNCTADNIASVYGFYNCLNINSCTVANSHGGFSHTSGYSGFTATNCNAVDNIYVGFAGLNNTIIECTANNSGDGSNGGFSNRYSTLINCVAFNNQGCGFRDALGGLNSYVDCTEYNNCLVWGSDCTERGCAAI